MKYKYEAISSTKAIIEIIPQTAQEVTLFNGLDLKNPDHGLTFHHYYEQGLLLNNASAVLLGIDQFLNAKTKAIISFEVVIGLGS